MQPDSRSRLHDALKATVDIREFVEGRDLATYRADPMLRAAVERKLIILGEALSQLARTDPGAVTQVPDHRRIIAFRNVLVHSYARIDDQVVWAVLQQELDPLESAVRGLLSGT